MRFSEAEWGIVTTGRSEMCWYEVTAAKITKTQNKPPNAAKIIRAPHAVLSAPGTKLHGRSLKERTALNATFCPGSTFKRRFAHAATILFAGPSKPTSPRQLSKMPRPPSSRSTASNLRRLIESEIRSVWPNPQIQLPSPACDGHFRAPADCVSLFAKLGRAMPKKLIETAYPSLEAVHEFDEAASPERLHALDAIRGFALLLGIILHATISFIAEPTRI